MLPFIHVLVPDQVLEDGFFGFSSVHRFLYSAGVHVGLLFLVLGVIINVAVLTPEKITIIQRNLRWSLLSPFISGVFFMTWVFIPDVNYNLLAYIFIGGCICIIAVYALKKFITYIKILKLTLKYKERLVEEGLQFIEENDSVNE